MNMVGGAAVKLVSLLNIFHIFRGLAGLKPKKIKNKLGYYFFDNFGVGMLKVYFLTGLSFFNELFN